MRRRTRNRSELPYPLSLYEAGEPPPDHPATDDDRELMLDAWFFGNHHRDPLTWWPVRPWSEHPHREAWGGWSREVPQGLFFGRLRH